ncbi:hypothetical protein PS2_014188 [Malus domestica]
MNHYQNPNSRRKQALCLCRCANPLCPVTVSRLRDGANDGFEPGSSSISRSGRARAQRMGGLGGARSSHHIRLRIWKNTSPRNGWPRRSPKFSSHLVTQHPRSQILNA